MKTPGSRTPVRLDGLSTPQAETLLVPACLELLAHLQQRFACRRQHLLSMGTHGAEPLGDATSWIRESNWVIDRPVFDRPLQVVLTGPLTRKAIVDGMNSSADAYCGEACGGDPDVIRGHASLCATVDGTAAYEDSRGYHALTGASATLMFRPRPWSEDEARALIGHHLLSASVFDVGVYTFHNATTMARQGTDLVLCLPTGGFVEARLWNDVLATLETELGLASHTIRVVASVQSDQALREFDEIMFELRSRLSAVEWLSDGYSHRLGPDVVRMAKRRGVMAMAHVGTDRQDETAMNDMIRLLDAGFEGVVIEHPLLAPMARGIVDTRNSGSARPAA